MRVSKQLVVIWGICAALMLAGCGQAQPENIPASQSSTVETDIPSIKSETEIKSDLAENQDFYALFDYNCYDSYGNYADSTYSIDELTITRRKTDEHAGTNDIYAAITASSPDSKYGGDFHLLYSLYDVGG